MVRMISLRLTPPLEPMHTMSSFGVCAVLGSVPVDSCKSLIEGIQLLRLSHTCNSVLVSGACPPDVVPHSINATGLGPRGFALRTSGTLRVLVRVGGTPLYLADFR
jgi:hypothetical protein